MLFNIVLCWQLFSNQAVARHLRSGWGTKTTLEYYNTTMCRLNDIPPRSSAAADLMISARHAAAPT